MKNGNAGGTRNGLRSVHTERLRHKCYVDGQNEYVKKIRGATCQCHCDNDKVTQREQVFIHTAREWERDWYREWDWNN